MGIVGGYPVGARAAITSYERGLCTKTECERMLSFCNNSGPAFILGVVGAGVFANSSAGMLLYLAHVLASLSVGSVFGFINGTNLLPVRAPSPMKRRSLPGSLSIPYVPVLQESETSVRLLFFSPLQLTCSLPPAPWARLHAALRHYSRRLALTAVVSNACLSAQSK